jgi:hypothetical protein
LPESALICSSRVFFWLINLAYDVAGKGVTRSFKSYGEAKTEAEKKVREIANGSQAGALTGEQSRDALAALQRLENFRQSTGRRFSVRREYVREIFFEGAFVTGESLEPAGGGFIAARAGAGGHDLISRT